MWATGLVIAKLISSEGSLSSVTYKKTELEMTA